MSKLIGKEKFLKLIEKAIPKHFNDLNTKHTFLLEANFMSNYWNNFKNTHKISTRAKDFTSLKIIINNREVILDNSVKNYFPYPNKSYLTYGHQHNKEGILIDLTDDVWNEIKKDGYFNLTLELELMPKDKDKQIAFKQSKDDEVIYVTYSTLSMKIHVDNIEDGEHLTLSQNLSRPIGFFLMEDYEEFNKFKNDEDFKNPYIKNEAFFIVKNTDLNSFIFWGLHQNLEFRIKPYSIYDKYQNIDKTMTFESFNFGNVLRCYKEDTKNEDFYKIVGVVSQKQE